ncbi:MAG: hypothetical protein R8G33_03440 [Gammaproteobacteria bacterium]|nr:hypothetical protein [Gammaproteobacteria bacterium]
MMHDDNGFLSHWGFGFGHWSLGFLFWILVIILIIALVKAISK